MTRRSLLAGAPIAFAACSRGDNEYFGRIDPPGSEQVVYLIGAEPATLDPAKSTDLWESYVVHALFEGLTSLHPQTGAPMAALATHYEVSPDALQYAFYLRGHAAPRGARLPNTSTLREEHRAGAAAEDFSRGRPAPPDQVPARWSDGTTITAHDIVYSWRRALDPVTAATYAYLMYYIRGAEEVNTGRLPAEQLAVRAVADFCVELELRTPASFFLELISNRIFCPTPRRAIETAKAAGDESSWTQPGRMVTSGPFTLASRRSNEQIELARNPHYYEAGIVALDTVKFFPVVDGSTAVNLYRAGEASMVQPGLPQLLPALSRKRDFRAHRSYGTVFPLINVTKPPFNDVRARYALNMATDKRAMANFAGAGRSAALNLVPAAAPYQAPTTLPISIDGRDYDVLSYNPEAARELFEKAVGHRGPVRVQYLFPNLPESGPKAEILQDQWRRTLGIELVLVCQELQTWLQTIFSKNYQGVADWGDGGGYVDPAWFLDQFTSLSAANGTGWADPRYDAMLASAAASEDASERMARLSECERYLLRGMPFVPLYKDVWTYLKKPFVKGLGTNSVDRHQFKYLWIDRNWSAA